MSNCCVLLTTKQNEVQCNEIIDWANGLVVVYDISDRTTFNVASNIVREARNSKHHKASSIPISIIANKQDLENGRKVFFHEGHQLAHNFSAKFFEVSSRIFYFRIQCSNIFLIFF